MPKILKKKKNVDNSNQQADIADVLEKVKLRLQQKKNILLYSILSVVIICVIIGSFFIYNNIMSNKANDLAIEGYILFYKSESNNLIPSEIRFSKALESFKNSYTIKKNEQVLLHIAYCNYNLGNYNETIKILKKNNDEFPKPEWLSLSNDRIAMSYLKIEDINNAFNVLSSISQAKEGILKDLTLMDMGKILEIQGNKEGAKNIYTQLINKFPNSSLVFEVKNRIINL